MAPHHQSTLPPTIALIVIIMNSLTQEYSSVSSPILATGPSTSSYFHNLTPPTMMFNEHGAGSSSASAAATAGTSTSGHNLPSTLLQGQPPIRIKNFNKKPKYRKTKRPLEERRFQCDLCESICLLQCFCSSLQTKLSFQQVDFLLKKMSSVTLWCTLVPETFCVHSVRNVLDVRTIWYGTPRRATIKILDHFVDAKIDLHRPPSQYQRVQLPLRLPPPHHP